MYGKNLDWIIKFLNFLLNGPAYETKAEAISTSPTISLIYSPRTSIWSAQRSFSEASAVTNLLARFKRNAHLLASAIAAFFSASAFEYFSLRIANSSFNYLQIS